ncbi:MULTISPECIES: hypothetical protein [Xanthomonas]|uniref:Uncharacterized protein n=1 Tax=Xanthomonas phaseoli pv. dieffenbachiae TaxID=92828 RepID=A0A1V9HEJ0_9XANT|nr:hypothetical protein [Xanthomonas phaseoli]MBO9767382.1 hypothetical protein [Xanthomonas phaseoli pv. dieffenbachiae]MBO9774902.1 hypothetical protein [Xanthomonas phaseoli pv. dieffenbachiae]MBO9779211.1 hypothetical protein [Xanthomonas phaseoli pv. dieffenbachiae]MBO9786341.1 hypothetical protein [Xanthomonas phaseoli pv. dieffenbachiae]MBO9795664.1 hypothetical protein [Xanthomonas phaseoli pv. dieffenbachiae]
MDLQTITIVAVAQVLRRHPTDCATPSFARGAVRVTDDITAAGTAHRCGVAGLYLSAALALINALPHGTLQYTP